MTFTLILFGCYFLGMIMAGAGLIVAVRWFPHTAAWVMFDHYSEQEWTAQECRNKVMGWFWVVVVGWWLSIFIILFMMIKATLQLIGKILKWAFEPLFRTLGTTARALAGADKE